MAHPPLGAPPMYSEFDPSEQLPGPNQLPNPHFANLNLRSQLQSQEHSYPREHLQQYQHPTHASLTPFETGKRTPLYNEGISSEEIRQEENFVESTLQWIPPLPSNQTRQFPRLEKPIIIPRSNVAKRLKAPLPFVRAYSPVLEAHGIQAVAYMEFMDNLAVAQAGSVVFQAMNAAGAGVGFVPWHWAQLTGLGIQVAAGVGSTAVAVVRTKKFLAASNERFFGPRGLKVSIKKDEEVAQSLGFISSTGDGSIERRRLAPVNMDTGCLTLCDRRMAALAPYISPLTMDVPPPTKQRNVLDKIAAMQLQRAMTKQEKAIRKKQAQAEEKHERIKRLQGSKYGIHQDQEYDRDDFVEDGSSSDSDSSVRSIERDVQRLGCKSEKVNQKIDSRLAKSRDKSKVAEIEKKRSKELAKLESERQKLEKGLEKRMKERAEKQQSRSGKSEKSLKRMDYIVIENID